MLFHTINIHVHCLFTCLVGVHQEPRKIPRLDITQEDDRKSFVDLKLTRAAQSKELPEFINTMAEYRMRAVCVIHKANRVSSQVIHKANRVS